MNNWKKIWESRKDTLGNVDAQDYRAVFIELKRIDGFDVNDGPSVESLLRQYENTKSALTVCGGGWQCV